MVRFSPILSVTQPETNAMSSGEILARPRMVFADPALMPLWVVRYNGNIV